jgi:hypothetical protein
MGILRNTYRILIKNRERDDLKDTDGTIITLR